MSSGYSASSRQQLAALDLIRTIFPAMKHAHPDGLPDDVRLALADVARTRVALKRTLIPGRKAVFSGGQYDDYMARIEALRTEIGWWFGEAEQRDARAYVYALLRVVAAHAEKIKPGNRGRAEWDALHESLAWLAQSLDPDLEALPAIDEGAALGDRCARAAERGQAA